MNNPKMTGMEQLRAMVRLFDDCRESFNDRFTVVELAAIYRAHIASGWDIYPDEWADFQVQNAIKYGTVPQWDYNDRPIGRNTDPTKSGWAQ